MKFGFENQTINEIGKLLVIVLSYLFSNGLYHISFGLNKTLRYLLKSGSYKTKFVKYPKPKDNEDILGILLATFTPLATLKKGRKLKRVPPPTPIL